MDPASTQVVVRQSPLSVIRWYENGLVGGWGESRLAPVRSGQRIWNDMV